MSTRSESTYALEDRGDYAAFLSGFVEASPSSYHAVLTAAEVLVASGFTYLDEGASWPALASGEGAFIIRDGALIAWRAGADLTPESPVRVLGCHTDSPGFVLKPQPDFSAEGWAQAGVEIYGGPLLNSWLDRDLEFAGRLVTTDGTEHLTRTGAVARIPQLAIHLDREVNSGLTLDRQRHVQPIIGVAAPDVNGIDTPSIVELLARGAGVSAIDIAGIDVRLSDTQPPARIGANRELLASGRLDNLSSMVAGLVALTATEPAAGTVSVLAAFDHEELGSETRSGASGPLLADVLARLRSGLTSGLDAREAVDAGARAHAASWCLSADAGHAAHPNYPEKHDPRVRPRPGAGPILKINANQRYATDAHGAALWRRLCDASGVSGQEFVSNNTVPCGSTIGPLTATRLGIRTVDVGVPLLSMHSARELAHVDDLHGLARVTAAFFAGE